MGVRARSAANQQRARAVKPMSGCVDLIRFVDGELEPEHAAAFRDHLSSCDACQSRLVEAMQLSTRLGSLGPAPDPAKQASVSSSTRVKRLIRRIASRPPEASPNRTGCAAAVVRALGMLLPAKAVTMLRMWRCVF